MVDVGWVGGWVGGGVGVCWGEPERKKAQSGSGREPCKLPTRRVGSSQSTPTRTSLPAWCTPSPRLSISRTRSTCHVGGWVGGNRGRYVSACDSEHHTHMRHLSGRVGVGVIECVCEKRVNPPRLPLLQASRAIHPHLRQLPIGASPSSRASPPATPPWDKPKH